MKKKTFYFVTIFFIKFLKYAIVLVIVYLISNVIMNIIMLTPWGSLPKDQENPQLISEAISEAIIAHEQDPTAHLGAGESLEQHKTNEVIDHPALSVVADKFSNADAFLNLNVYPFILDSCNNCSGNDAPPFIFIEQSSGETGDGYYNIFYKVPSDVGYDNGDILIDFITNSYGNTGAWNTEVFLSFATVQFKYNQYRVGYYNGSWNYSNWITHSVAKPLRFRVEYNTIDGLLNFYLRDDLVYSVSYTINFENDELLIYALINRNSTSNLQMELGNFIMYLSGF